MRLTNNIREAICGDLIEHRFAKEAEGIAAKFSSLAFDIREALFGGPEGLAKAEALPKDWLIEKSYITFVTGKGYQGDLYFSGWCGHALSGLLPKNTQNEKRVPISRTIKDVALLDTLADRYETITNERDKLVERIKTARSKTDSTLKSYKTVKTLIAAWPEIEPFIPKDAMKIQLPALRTAELNDMLDLPVDLVL